jgi:hypothetical protein
MGKRLLLVLAFVAGLAAASTNPASAAQAVGKTGLYKDGCGNTHVWVNGQDLGPQYLVCMPPDADH